MLLKGEKLVCGQFMTEPQWKYLGTFIAIEPSSDIILYFTKILVLYGLEILNNESTSAQILWKSFFDMITIL